MPTSVTVILACLLLALALAPWIVSSCASPPLMPESLVQERTHYEATVDTARTATMEAQRSAESDRRVVVVGTAPALVLTTPLAQTVETGGMITATLAFTGTAGLAASGTAAPSASAASHPSPTTTGTPTPRPTSVVTIRIAPAGPTPTATTKVIVVQARDATPVPLASATIPASATTTGEASRAAGTPITATTTPPQAGTQTPPAPRPANMVDVEDVITEQMLNEQVLQDADSDTIKDLAIELSPDGIRAHGTVAVLFGLRRPIQMQGTFAVEEERLVAVASSIIFDGRDVTEQYRHAIEDRVNWSLYKLLPQRYVRSYELSWGQVKVHSQMRRQ